MNTKTEKLFKHINIGVSLLLICITAQAQVGDYFVNRVKVGDIYYVDAGDNDRFIDYRSWDQGNPPGVPKGIVVYAHYGPKPADPTSEPAWHGWIVAIQGSEPMAWAPTGSICYNNCVAAYAVPGISTYFNPNANTNLGSMGDTCGWQNTYRVLEFIYTGQGTTLSSEISPVFHHLLSDCNGVTDFSSKPTMSYTSWYLPSYGQLKVMVGSIGAINAALNACGQTEFTITETFWTSSEYGPGNVGVAWAISSSGVGSTSPNWLKNKLRSVRPFRNF